MENTVAIIGAGPGGCAAAVQAARLGAAPTLFDPAGVAGGLIRCAWRIENHPATGGPISGTEYANRLEQWIASFGISVSPHRVDAIRLLPDGSLELLASGEYRPASACVLAVGTAALKLGVPGEVELTGHLVHHGSLPSQMPGYATAAVIGGGEAGLDIALNCADRGIAVTVFFRSRAPRARGRLVQLATAHPLISFAPGHSPVSFEAAGSGMAMQCNTPHGLRSLPFGFAVVAIGRVRAPLPRFEGFDESVMSNTIATNVPGLFIVGDARLGALGQAVAAAGDGVLAAMMAAEGHR